MNGEDEDKGMNMLLMQVFLFYKMQHIKGEREGICAMQEYQDQMEKGFDKSGWVTYLGGCVGHVCYLEINQDILDILDIIAKKLFCFWREKIIIEELHKIKHAFGIWI